MINALTNTMKSILQSIFSPEMEVIERKVQQSVSVIQKRKKVINLCITMELLLTIVIALLLFLYVLIILN